MAPTLARASLRTCHLLAGLMTIRPGFSRTVAAACLGGNRASPNVATSSSPCPLRPRAPAERQLHLRGPGPPTGLPDGRHRTATSLTGAQSAEPTAFRCAPRHPGESERDYGRTGRDEGTNPAMAEPAQPACNDPWRRTPMPAARQQAAGGQRFDATVTGESEKINGHGRAPALDGCRSGRAHGGISASSLF